MNKLLVSILMLFIVTSMSWTQTRPDPATPFGETVQQVTGSTGQQLSKIMAPPPPPYSDLTALTNGGDRLVGTQYTDGAWGWDLIAPPTYGNIHGPIGMGLAQAYLRTGSATQLGALSDAAAYFLLKTTFSTADGYLAAQLDAIYGGTTYTSYIKTNFYEKLALGTYVGTSGTYDTQGYVNAIRTSRASQGLANLAAWDLGMGLVGAAMCGVTGTELGYWIAGVKAEINELVSGAPNDVLGLAGAVYGLAYVNEEIDPTAGQHAPAGNLGDLASILLGYQIPASGGFTYDGLDVTSGNETIQETAYSILALAEFNFVANKTDIQSAAQYMMSVQLSTGGWENDLGSIDGENNEITGEALWGIAAAYPSGVDS
ncbi:MAG: hypothetical protein WC824_01325, partial [Bacteroidota bacterium]